MHFLTKYEYNDNPQLHPKLPMEQKDTEDDGPSVSSYSYPGIILENTYIHTKM